MYSSKYDKQQAFENEYNKYQKDRDNKTQQELKKLFLKDILYVRTCIPRCLS